MAYNDEERHLWYSIPAEHETWFSAERSDGFLVGLLLQAMERNAPIILEAPVSSRLIHNLNASVIPMLAQAFLNLHHIEIKAAALIDESAEGQGVCTGFSGGVDSFAAFIQHYLREASQDFKLTHLLFHNVGSHGEENALSPSGRRLFSRRYELVRAFAAEAGLPIVKVDSNLSEVFTMNYITMHSALNASVPLLLQKQFQRYFYASAYKYADCAVTGTDDIAHFDPFVIHLFSTEGLDCVSTGCQLSRVEKTALVATCELSYRHLNVCVDPAFDGKNCSVCFKCCRTILTLELLGVAQSYVNVFDLNRFEKVRVAYFREVLSYKRGSFEAEIAELYRAKGRGIGRGLFAARQMLDKMLAQARGPL